MDVSTTPCELGYTTVDAQRHGIGTEMLVACGLARTGFLQTMLRPLVWLPAHRFAQLAAGFDRRVGQNGLLSAIQWVLPNFIDGVNGVGVENIPASGPLIVASNHPGSYDSISILSLFPRQDVKILVSDVPFLRGMLATSPYLIYTSHDPYQRMKALRATIRHLRAGGSILLFASAQVDPDPAFLSGAKEALNRWSSSIPLLLRKVPQVRLVPAIVRGVLSPLCFHHPLVRIRREQRLQQFLAEFLQVSWQVLFNRQFGLRPTVTFDRPLDAANLVKQDDEEILALIIERAANLLPGAPNRN